jgi:nucleoside 2-deoxyribosyltransferase
MKIYFSCSLTGGRRDEAAYRLIVDQLQAMGHEVLTAHLAYPQVMQEERSVDPAEVYRRDVNWIEECQALVAEVSTPSHGVGYEIALALQRGKPVLCLHREGVPVSKMITGNDSAGLEVRAYRQEAAIAAVLQDYLGDLPGAEA